MTKAEKSSKLEELLNGINKENGEIMFVGLPDYNYTKIPFSSPRMNYCTFGGLPTGCLIEFFGENHGGKTTTALDIVANYQQMENARQVMYCDCENTLDAKWAKQLGVDIDSLILMQPKGQSAECILEIIKNAIDTGEVGLVVIDSIGALVSQQELDKSIEDKTYGGISLALTRFAKEAEMSCKKNDCTLIGINQTRQVIGAMFPTENTPGGNAWKFLCNGRLEFKRGKFIDEKGNEISRGSENPAGNVVLMTIIKSKFCPPTRRIGSYTIKYLSGIDWKADLIEVAIKYNVVEKNGGWYKIIDPDSGEVKKDKIQGMNNLCACFDEDTKLFEWFKETVYSCMEQDN